MQGAAPESRSDAWSRRQDMMPPRECLITLTARIHELQGIVEVLASGRSEIDPWVANLAVLRVKSKWTSCS